MRIANTPDSEKEHPRSISSIRRAANTSGVVRNDDGSSPRENHPTSIGSLCPSSSSSSTRNASASASASSSEIHLTCSWRAILGQAVVRGEHYLRKIPIAPRSFLEGVCPIAARAEHATRTEHDFSKTPVALVPWTMTLKNRMLETPLRFTWSWVESKSKSESSTQAAQQHSSSCLEPIGTCAQTLELDPTEETEIPLEVLVTEAGVHDLQNLRFVVHRGKDPNNNTEEEEDVTYHLSQQWLIHLVDSSSQQQQQ
jgi:hypothetical protein